MTGPEKFAGPVKLGVAAEKPPEETNDPEKVAGPVKFGVAAVKPFTFKFPELDIDVTT
jgi:hypothetical protein